MLIRLFDIVFSITALVVFSPLLLLITACLLLTGEHHVIYRQKRAGKEGKEFDLLKFATMVADAPNLPGGMHTLVNDPRLLPMGKFLRKTKINELPQLLNILKGDMSFIGYRPTITSVYKEWPEWARNKLRFTEPGLSGIGSIVFRNEEELLQKQENKTEYYLKHILPYKVELECWYYDHKTVFLYLHLIILTMDAVLGGQKWKKIKGLPEIPKDLQGGLNEVNFDNSKSRN